jgi:PTH1 family peptidyl-tRNA hydrolase
MIMQSIRLIVGLGNPGEKYTKTRHNAGFWLTDELANQFHGQFRAEQKFSAKVAKIMIGSSEVWLSQPTTFMNRSGVSVHQIANFYKIPAEEILVAHDEIDLPPGTIRLKQGGGHGGHNGLRDITQQIGKTFWRLRIGVGHPGHKDQVVNYVLGHAGKTDEAFIYDNIAAAVNVTSLIVAGKFEKAMNQLHRPS